LYEHNVPWQLRLSQSNDEHREAEERIDIFFTKISASFYSMITVTEADCFILPAADFCTPENNV